jgi:hypothetical protein
MNLGDFASHKGKEILKGAMVGGIGPVAKKALIASGMPMGAVTGAAMGAVKNLVQKKKFEMLSDKLRKFDTRRKDGAAMSPEHKKIFKDYYKK